MIQLVQEVMTDNSVQIVNYVYMYSVFHWEESNKVIVNYVCILYLFHWEIKLLCCVCVGLGTCVDMYMFSVYDWHHSIERDLITIV